MVLSTYILVLFISFASGTFFPSDPLDESSIPPPVTKQPSTEPSHSIFDFLGLGSSPDTSEPLTEEEWPSAVKIIDMDDVREALQAIKHEKEKSIWSKWFGLFSSDTDKFDNDVFGENNAVDKNMVLLAIPGWRNSLLNPTFPTKIFPGLVIPATFSNYSSLPNSSFSYYHPLFHNLTGFIPFALNISENGTEEESLALNDPKPVTIPSKDVDVTTKISIVKEEEDSWADNEEESTTSSPQGNEYIDDLINQRNIHKPKNLKRIF